MSDAAVDDARQTCWQSVQDQDGITACGCERDGFYVLSPANEQLARYGPQVRITTAYEALEWYRVQRTEAERLKGSE